MIELTVKTLDSQNHSFSVPDDTTVKQLKERIAESINFPIESQRLIYCGRVLQDEKNLSEYDVNGKVIHLVQRPPPQANRPSNGNQSGSRSTSGSQRRHHHFRQPRVDGNAMYLGAMAFPADLMDAQGIQAPPSSNTLSSSRVLLARCMLQRATNVLNRLENPTTQDADPETPPGETDNGSVEDATSSSNVTNGSQHSTLPGGLAQATQAATAAAIAAAVSAAHAVGVPNITIVRSGQQQPENVELHFNGDANASNEQATNDAPMQDAQSSETSNTDQPTATAATSSDETPTRGSEMARTSVMAELLDSLNQINLRLQPYMQRYQQYMQDDPTFDQNSSSEEAQHIFNGVSEVFHNLSHAYHAMSDIMCDFSQTPPRNLRCRPVLIQHSAVLQAGIPIQAQINVMTNRNRNNASSTAESRSRQATGSQTNTSASAVAGTNTQDDLLPTADAPPAQENTSQTRTNEVPTSNQNPENNAPQPTIHITPGNLEFYMEVGPGSITIDSVEATVVTNSNSSGGSNTTGADSNGAGNFPWGAPPPSEFIQNIVQALGGHMIGRAEAALASNATNTMGAQGPQGRGNGGATGGSAAAGGGQNSQARGNTATHPTTATQTRSTSRPHVHLAPAAVQGLGSNYFDPFLPCNSHHIQCRRRTAQQSQQSSSASSNTEQPSSNQTSVPQASEQQSESAQERETNPPVTQDNATPNTNPPTSAAAGFTALWSSLMNMPGTHVRMPPINITPLLASRQNRNFARPTPPTTTQQSTTPPRPVPPMFNQGQQEPNIHTLLLNMPPELRNIAAGVSQIPILPQFDQIMQSLAGVLDLSAFAQLGGGTLADILQSLPDHSYVEGHSVFLDFMMTLARNMVLNDVITLAMGNSEPLNRIRPQLREFVSQRVLQGAAPTEENVSQAVGRLLREFRPFLESMSQARLRDDIDLISSTNQYHQYRLPDIINLIMADGREATFGTHVMQWCRRYMKEMSAIILHCCVDNIQGLETIVRNYVQQMTSGVHPDIQQWTINNTVNQLRSYVSQQNVPQEDIQPFLVYRIRSTGAVPPATMEPDLAADTQSAPAQDLPEPEPMETDGFQSVPSVIENHVTTEPQKNGVQSPSSLVMDTEHLPDVVLGSETWHNCLPSEWVPIITRDTQRQRRQNPQTPFSDAYLAGMPSKRRKIVTSSKPQGNLNQIISDGVKQAVTTAGMRQAPCMDTPGEDLELQAAYREQMRSALQDSISDNSDVTDERFPNISKYFTK